jgi:hypothetical protein
LQGLEAQAVYELADQKHQVFLLQALHAAATPAIPTAASAAMNGSKCIEHICQQLVRVASTDDQACRATVAASSSQAGESLQAQVRAQLRAAVQPFIQV